MITGERCQQYPWSKIRPKGLEKKLMSAQANLKILLLRIRTKKKESQKIIQILENLHTCYDCVSGKAVEVGVTMYVLSISSLSEVEMVLGKTLSNSKLSFL